MRVTGPSLGRVRSRPTPRAAEARRAVTVWRAFRFRRRAERGRAPAWDGAGTGGSRKRLFRSVVQCPQRPEQHMGPAPLTDWLSSVCFDLVAYAVPSKRVSFVKVPDGGGYPVAGVLVAGVVAGASHEGRFIKLVFQTKLERSSSKRKILRPYDIRQLIVRRASGQCWVEVYRI